ncbi:unnamed protein product, partial [Thelazia callipaeda]|uniref:CUB domain-containing protein n=1 Tax=Thelazia callipaeda TaxID=103827 RepID=A0A0N5CPC3_THECL
PTNSVFGLNCYWGISYEYFHSSIFFKGETCKAANFCIKYHRFDLQESFLKFWIRTELPEKHSDYRNMKLILISRIENEHITDSLDSYRQYTFHLIFRFQQQSFTTKSCDYEGTCKTEDCTLGLVGAKYMGYVKGPLVKIWDCCCHTSLCNAAFDHLIPKFELIDDKENKIKADITNASQIQRIFAAFNILLTYIRSCQADTQCIAAKNTFFSKALFGISSKFAAKRRTQ